MGRARNESSYNTTDARFWLVAAEQCWCFRQEGSRDESSFPVFRLAKDDNVQRPAPRRWMLNGSSHPGPLLPGNVTHTLSLSRAPRRRILMMKKSKKDDD